MRYQLGIPDKWNGQLMQSLHYESLRAEGALEKPTGASALASNVDFTNFREYPSDPNISNHTKN